MILNSGARRLGIFAYFDADGIVDDYVAYLVSEVGKHCVRQVCIVNGTLTQEDADKLRAAGGEVVFRENRGYDITAYRDALLAQDLSDIDEVLFYNQTIFGPVCPLDAMFAQMNARDVDFWGLSRHKGAKHASWDENEAFPPHVQSYWFAVRKPMLTDGRFLDYWNNLPAIETYWDAVRKHEVRFTKHFADLGFVWDVFLHTEDDEICNDYPLMGKPKEMLEQGCPFVKRKVFLMDRTLYTSIPQGGAAQAVWDYLRDKTQYPVRLIAQNITRTATLSEVTQAFVPYYDVSGAQPSEKGVTAVLYFARAEQAALLIAAAKARPYEKLYALFANEALRTQFQPELPETASCAVCGESGHGVQVLFRLLYPAIRTPYVMYLTNDLPLLLREFQDETTLRAAVDALTAACETAFDREPCLGALFPPVSVHQNCATLGADWPETGAALEARLRDAGLRCPLGVKTTGIAVRGGMFFARREALAPLAKFKFAAEDFAGEYPAWEYLAPLAAHGAGLLIGYSARYAELGRLLTNVSAMLTQTEEVWQTKNNRTFDRVLFRMKAIRDFYYERRFQMTLEQAFEADLTWKQKLWICLQIILKPETFRKLHPGTGEEPAHPEDVLD